MSNIVFHERKNTGTKANKKLRKEGFIPSVCYGGKSETTPIAVSAKEFSRVWKEAGESTVIESEGALGKKSVIIHDVFFDPITGRPIHADFLAVSKDVKITAKVNIKFEGTSKAVKEMGAVLIQVMHSIDLEALPQDLPHEVIADLSLLEDFSSHITVGDIKLPNGVEAKDKPDTISASVTEQKEEKIEDQTEQTVDSVEVEKKGKKEAEGEVAEEGEQAKKK